PEPHHEMPQAASAHDTFWDFISLMPESMHMIMWLMSDRAIPRSYRMQEGFGVHTFRFINAENESHFVKFHWKPKLGTHAVVWDEAQKISGNNPDFHRADLWEAIELGNFPEWEFGVQIVPEADEHKFDFDLLDSTKIIPEELVPVTIVGRMVLNKNPNNFFAETEQVAFHPGHIIPGIDFTNDPLLQGRLFSYTDTQLSRLGSPNFHEIPINRSISPIHNNQRDGHMRQEINKGRVSYHPNSLGGGCPYQAMIADGGFSSFNERIEAHKVRQRSNSFRDHFSQARMFYESQTPTEQQHIVKAFRFELGKVETTAIRVRMLGLIAQVNRSLAEKVAIGLGAKVPEQPEQPTNHGVGADDQGAKEPIEGSKKIITSDALSMIKNPTVKPTINSRKVAFLCNDGVNETSVMNMKKALLKENAKACIIGPHLGFVATETDGEIAVDFSFLTSSSVLFDALFIPDGKNQDLLAFDSDVMEFLNDAYRHCKIIGADGDGIDLLSAPQFLAKGAVLQDEGIIKSNPENGKSFQTEFISAIKMHRYWKREEIIDKNNNL
ncbi:MAG TPA: catalase, partial [Chitinispirillaceae bacterium]|nr:catalase [Chitinispirillaceae bacterium]